MKKSSFKRSLAMFLAILMLVTSFPIVAFATDQSGKGPYTGETQGQPFIAYEPSQIYRIPCMVSFPNGDGTDTIVTAADARWGAGADGGGNDTIISRSEDSGKTWTYQMTNYYPDNGDMWNEMSTSACDSELILGKDNDIYLLTTFCPAGYAINKTSAKYRFPNDCGTAFNSDGNVKLFKNGEAGQFNYYIGVFGSDGKAPIMNNNGSETGYYVDHDYYIYNGTTATGGNLFYDDGDFQTAKVNFLLFRKSTDGGKTWSDFVPLNVKKETGEAFYGVGPGRGIYDAKNERLIFSCYSWSEQTTLGGLIDQSDQTQRSSFIYYDLKENNYEINSNGWHRSPNFPDLPAWSGGTVSNSNKWSSENALVQMSDRVLRCFVRNQWGKLIYADAILQDDGSYVWDPKYTDLQFVTKDGTGCQLSAIKYSKQLQYNGKYYTAVLVSTPTSYKEDVRRIGQIYTVLFDDQLKPVNANNSNQKNNKSISYLLNSSYFDYSCLTELSDGSISVLYEVDKANNITYRNIKSITEITGLRAPDDKSTVDIAFDKNETKTFLTETNQFTKTEANASNPAFKELEFTERIGCKANLGDSSAYDGETIWLKDALFDFSLDRTANRWTISAMGVYMSVYSKGYPSTATKKAVQIIQDDVYSDYFKFVDDANEALGVYRDPANPDNMCQFDQSTKYGGSTSDGPDHREMCLFEVYRPAEVGEDASKNTILGYVRITNMNDIKDGGRYLIGYHIGSDYYFLYPSTSTNNTYSHAVKANLDAVPAGYYMTVTALRKGSAVIAPKTDEDLVTYNCTVGSDLTNEILGVVEYEPVIYTHGSLSSAPDMSFSTIGDFIADGTYYGEKDTQYKFRTIDNVDLSTQYKIDSISAYNADTGEILNADITFENGKLHGTLPLANNDNFKSYRSGTYVLLKTKLIETATGNEYIQTDKLYVASNPVPGHIALGNGSFVHNVTNTKYWNVRNAIFLLAPDSYGNTEGYSISDTKSNYHYNVQHIDDEKYTMTYNDVVDGIQGPKDDTGVKFGGNLQVTTYSGTSNGTRTNTHFSDNNVKNVTIAYYYYDKSSPYNEGVTPDPNDPSNFSLQFNHQKINLYQNNSEYTSNRYFIDNDANNYIAKLSGSGTITTTTGDNMFGKGWTSGDPTWLTPGRHVESIVQCSTKEESNEKVTPNTTASLRGIVKYSEAEYTGSGRNVNRVNNNARLTFEVIMCDKSEERKAYNDTISTVLKSTDFTTSTWKRYMDTALVYQEYLNNYTILTTAQNKDNDTTKPTYEQLLHQPEQAVDKNGNEITVDSVDSKFGVIQKSATFPVLEKALDENRYTYDTGIEFPDGTYYTPSTYKDFVTAFEAGQDCFDKGGANAEILDPAYYSPDEIRAQTPGYKVGPNPDPVTDRLDIQVEIETDTNAINEAKNNLKLAADDSAYIAAEDESYRIDTSAYDDSAATIRDEFSTTHNAIYTEYNSREYVDISDQAAMDDYVASVLTEMTVAAETSNINVKKYNVTFKENGNVIAEKSGEYRYGDYALIDFSGYMNGDNIVECIVNTDTTDGKVDTTVNLNDYAGMGYVIPVLVQQDITINLNYTPKSERTVTVVDYYGTVIGVYAGDEVIVDSVGKTVTVNNTADGTSNVVKVKPSPKYEFTGWSLADNTYPITEPMTIKQVGNLNPLVHVFNAINGSVNSLSEFSSNYVNTKLSLESENGKFWTRRVNGATEETLASYEQNFVNFSSNEDVEYKAYNSVDELPAELQLVVSKGTPAVYGTAYYVDQNKAFTLSVDYSAPLDKVKDKDGKETDELRINVLDAGVIYSTSASTLDGLVKGAADTRTIAANRIAHWTNNANSGTFTITKNNAEQGTYYMRAYVSYTAKYGDYTLPYVVYSDYAYKCENGVITIVQ